MRSRVTGRRTLLLAYLGTKTVGLVLVLRGAGGLVVSSLGMLTETVEFRRANLLLYSPLCLALGAATLWSSPAPITGPVLPSVSQAAK